MADVDSEDEEKIVERYNRRRGPSTTTITFGGIIAVASLLASGVATYNAVMNDIATLKRGEVYQERVNDDIRVEFRAIRQELKDTRVEQREGTDRIATKVDRLIESWPSRRAQ